MQLSFCWEPRQFSPDEKIAYLKMNAPAKTIRELAVDLDEDEGKLRKQVDRLKLGYKAAQEKVARWERKMYFDPVAYYEWAVTC